MQGLVSAGLEIRNQLDDEECSLLSMSLPSVNAGPGSVAPGKLQARAGSTPAAAASKARAKAKTPGLAASKVRKDTIKLFSALQPAATSALAVGQDALAQAASEHGSFEEACAASPEIQCLLHRVRCLELLLDDAQSKSAVSKSEEIYEELIKDEYFNDQNWSVAHVQTLGYMKYVRNTMLELQRTCDAVDDMGQAHREAIVVLRDVASAVTKQATEWRSQVQASKKARILEQKALEKEAERQIKAEAKKKAREEAKQKRAEEKAQKEAAAAEKRAAEGAAEEDPTKNKRRRKQADGDGVEDHDRTVLKSLVDPNFPKSKAIATVGSFQELAKFIASTSGMLPAIFRCRRSSLKKCFEARCLF